MKYMLTIIALLLVTATAADAGIIKGRVDGGRRLKKSPAIVYLADAGKKFKAPAMNPTMDQKNMTFIPHVLPIQVGTTVDFLNNDEVRHNVFSPDKEKFNLGTWPAGEIKQHLFAQKGVYTLLCNVHVEMEAFIVVLDTPYFTLTAGDGSYELADVPAGEYTVKVWHEKLRFKKQQLTVPGGGETRVDFTSSRNR